MNAAFLLVTSALLVGQPAAEKKLAPPPAVTAPVASCCGQDSCGCDGFGHRFRDKLRGMFSRGCCDSCQPAKCETKCETKCHTHAHFRSSCEEACTPKLFNWQPACRTHHDHCAPSCAPACTATCDSCERGGFLSKLRDRFKRHDSCCDAGCGDAGCGAAPARGGEKIDTTPKKMPVDPPKDKKKPEEVRFETQSAPFVPNVIQVGPTVPSVEIAPVPAPRVEGERRDPF